MRRDLRIALGMASTMLVVTGVLYPLLVTLLAQVLFPWRADGSLVGAEGRVVGSELIGQRFESPAYFHGRPSAAGQAGYDGAASSGSNLGPTSRRLRARVVEDLARLRRENPQAEGPVPVDLVSASASGLDPHITPEGAAWQIPRVAQARGLSEGAVARLVQQATADRFAGLLGEPRVNVLRVNTLLDEKCGRPKSTALPEALERQ